jgi:hypothetical protein
MKIEVAAKEYLIPMKMLYDLSKRVAIKRFDIFHSISKRNEA